MRKKKTFKIGIMVIFGFVFLLISGCASAPAGDSEENYPFLEGGSEVETITTNSGLQYQELETGTGAEANPGDTVVVHYTGWLTDGTKFDSSVDRNEPFVFPLGAGRVIRGWDEGVAGMQVGGKRRLIIPAALGYGSQGAGNVIPPDATLIFEVELLDIQ